MTGTVLVVDDNSEHLELARTWLKESGFEAITATDGVEGLRRFYAGRPDLVILDVRMPRMDGWEVCRRVRDMCDVPIIMVTVSAQQADLARGYGLGIDDYITKPVHFPELIARVHAVLRRSGNSHVTEGRRPFHNDEIDIDWRSHCVWVRGQQVPLSRTEFRLLECLIENRGWAVPREELLRKVWGQDYFGDEGCVKLYIRYLREKIEADASNPKWILTERGVGYRFHC